MKQIDVSIDVFARIWALRQSGEDTEDAILHRLLDRAGTSTALSPLPQAPLPSDGFWDKRHNVHFPEGLEIFRTYKGSRFSAKALGGAWVLSDGRKFSSLNELSRTITSGTENAWVNWNYRDGEGKTQRISELRERDQVSKRKVPATPVGDQGEQKPENGAIGISTIWRHDVVEALRSLGGQATLERIYRKVERIRRGRGASLPPSTEAIIRRELEYNSSDSSSYTGRYDLFFSVDGLGSGVWGLR